MSLLLLLAACTPADKVSPVDSGPETPLDSGEPAEDPVYEPVDALRFEPAGALERGEMELLHVAPDLNGDGLRALIFLDGEDLVQVPLRADLSFGAPSALPFGRSALAQPLLEQTGGQVNTWSVEATDAGDLDGDGDDELLLEVWIGVDGGSVSAACGTFAYDDQGFALLHLTTQSTCTPAQLLADVDGDGGAELILHETSRWTITYSGGGQETVSLASGMLSSVYNAHSHFLHLNDDPWPELVAFPDGGFGFAGGGAAQGSAEGLGELVPYEAFVHGYTTASDREAERPSEVLLLDSSGRIWWLGAGVDVPTPLTEERWGAWQGLFGQLDGVPGLDALLLGDAPGAFSGDGQGGLTELSVDLDLEDGQVFSADLDGDGLDELVLDQWVADAQVQIWRNASQDN